MNYEILEVLYENQYKNDIRNIRDEVFIKEQNIDKSIEFDGKDDEALHVLIYSENKAIATGRILSDGRIGRVAVLKEFRKKGLGLEIVSSLVNQAKKKNFEKVYLDSQEDAIIFYEKLGFELSGKMFIKANINHQTMIKSLKG